MKKLLTFILISLLLLTSYTWVLASTSNGESIKEILKVEKIDNDPEKGVFMTKLDLSKDNLNSLKTDLKWQKTPSKTGEFYKIYNIRENIRKYNVDSNFQKFISENNRFWETPIFAEDGTLISTTRISKVNGKWYSSTGLNFPLDLVEFYLDYNNIYNVLKSNKIEKPEMVKHVRMREIHTDLIYIKDGSSEYAIPLVFDAKELNIENFKLYKMAEIIDKLSVKYGDPHSTNKSSSIAGGSNNNISWQNNLILGLIICALFSFMVALIFAHRRQSSH